MPKKSKITLTGTVEKIIPPLSPHKPEMAQISLETDQLLYRERVRIENTLTNDAEGKVSLKLGSPVEVTITAEAGCTTVQSRIPVPKKP